MSDQEYTVESIIQARVSKKRKKLFWEFLVKWQGYGIEDNTWEPITSFSDGSEHMIDAFWQRANSGGRNITDLSLFEVGEEFFPLGPPRRTKRKSIVAEPKAHTPSSPELVEAALEPDEPQVESRKSGKKRRREETSSHESRAKRSRKYKSRSSLGKQEARTRSPVLDQSFNEQSLPSAAHASTGQAKALEALKRKQKSTSTTPRPKKVTPQSSLKNDHSNTPDDPIALGDINELSDMLPDVEDVDSVKPVGASGSRQARSHGAISPAFEMSDHALEGIPTAELILNDTNGDTHNDATNMDTSPSLASVPITQSSSHNPSLPSHRARVANPLVKLVDPDFSQEMAGALPVKARVLGLNVVNPDEPVTSLQNDPGSSRYSGPNENGDKHRKVVPPRLSQGLSRRGSSLLTFQKGSLKTLKRQSKLPSNKVDTAQNFTQMHENERISPGEGSSIYTWNSDEPVAESASGLNLEGISTPSEGVRTPPAGDDLLRLAGFTEDANALPDFENPSLSSDAIVIDKPSTPTDDDPLAAEQASTGAGTSNLLKSPSFTRSLHAAAQKLFPSSNTASLLSLSGVSAAWKRTTIFGPLGIGSDMTETHSQDDQPLVAAKPTFFLTLDPSISMPIFLKDIQYSPGLRSLEDIVAQNPKGPPGKFYEVAHIQSVLDTLRTGGSSGRIALGADETHKAHFERFCGRLQNGEMFVSMAGFELLAFCSSENATLCRVLGVPQGLIGLQGAILVSHVIIENHSAYADSADHAVRW